MIFSYNDMGPGSIFKGRVLESPYDWNSYIPSPELTKDLFSDGAFASNLGHSKWDNIVSSGQSAAQKYISELYYYNMVSATRQILGEMAQVSGFIKKDIINITDIYQDKIGTAVNGLMYFDKVVSSDLFKQGLDAIGVIPIVGWIIKIVTKAAILVSKIVQYFRNEKEEKARQKIVEQFSIPVSNFERDADQALTRGLFESIAYNNAQKIAEPIFDIKNVGDLIAINEKLNPDSDVFTKAFVLIPEDEKFSGYGFVPGTRILNRQIKLPTIGCAGVSDYGEFFPTTAVAASQWWETCLEQGPSMFTIDSNKLYYQWENYINLLIAFAENVKLGWSCERTGVSLTDKFTCVEELYGYKGCKASKVGENLKTNSDGHYYAYRKYLFDLFFDYQHKGLPLINDNKGSTADNIDYSKSVPAKALDNLVERQVDVLDSLYCMYVNDSDRFLAIRNSHALKDQWKKNVQIIFDSNDWKNVIFEDVPEGPVKSALYQKCKQNQINCNELGKGMIIDKLAQTSVLGDPEPPKPPNPITLDERLAYEKSKSKKSKSSKLPLMLGAAALTGFFALKK